MSYEYLIRLDSGKHSADNVMSELRRGQIIVYEKDNCIALKDPESLNTWAYGLRVFKVGENELHLEITNTTNDLYESIRSALPSGYSITEVEDEDELSLAQIFRSI
jgi:hypothetical protein